MGRAARLVLTAPAAPLELHGPFTADQAVRDAMNAALRGDWRALEVLEVTYLNVLVRIGELYVKDAHGTPHWWFDAGDARFAGLAHEGLAPFVTAYLRSYGPRCEPALEWQLRVKCRRCAGLLRRLDCWVCGGTWHVEDMNDHELVYTTTEGVLLEADA